MATTNTPARTTGHSQKGERAAPGSDFSGLWAFLRQAAVVAGATAFAGGLAVLFFAQLQGAL